ncbi:hypothetical protein FA13DRAFT_1745591 [Coprinellus micaceus]|uniref:DUF6533 domain-containing protein n=1 Tax=Coprinellus micaceus TaxID=71717 RepID=A0A4Y7SB61_COPMI|nr:hypothetical protein FA13DRAFT_1745591 [Coprinellus micaceus]
MAYSPEEIDRFTFLYTRNIIPLRVVLASFTWVLHDYFDTLEDEIRYIWPQKLNAGKIAYLFVRYYTIALLLFDVIQIHTFAIPGVTSNAVCLAMDPTIRVVGAISLWAIEIIMQLRIYAIFDCSKKVAAFNGLLFLASIGCFIWILAKNAIGRAERIASAIRLPLPGCPAINGGLHGPTTVFEGVLFGFVLYKAANSLTMKVRLNQRWSISQVLLGDNILYFFGISALLVVNNVMASGVTSKYIPWFSYGPFHAAMGIMTTRMLMHLRKVALHSHRASTFTRSEFMGDSMLMDASDLYNQKFAAPDSIKTIGGSSRESTRFSARNSNGTYSLSTLNKPE